MYRIPFGRYRHNRRGPRPVVLLHHGITLSSASFVVLNANESTGFILADAGFDVWMANTRGNTYSRGNLLWRSSQPEYWYISIDDLALRDLPAQIDYTLAKTGAKKIGFVGHSQGSMVLYMLLSELDGYNDKISVAGHLAPVVFPQFLRGPFLRYMAESYGDLILKQLAWGEFMENRITSISLVACQVYPLGPACVEAINYMLFGPSRFMPPDDFVTIATTWPSSVASRNLEHWAQMMRANNTRLQRYDYGNDCRLGPRKPFYESCNQRQYGTWLPPQYNITRIRAPMAIFHGASDIMSVPADVELQHKRTAPGVIVADYQYESYSHMDFVWDRNAKHKADLVDLLFRFSPGTY